MSTFLEYRERERQRKRESRRQASKERQRARGREKSKGDIFLLEEQHESFVAAVRKWEMLAATKVKVSGSEKKKGNVHTKILGTLSNYYTTTTTTSKNNWFYDQNNSAARASRFLVHFIDVHCKTTTSNLPTRRFIEDVDIRRQIFLSLFEHR